MRETASTTPNSDASSSDSPRLETHGRVASIVFRRTTHRNALHAEALCVLEQRVAESRLLVDRNEVDVIVVRGDGAAFCAGFDLASCAEDPRRVEELLIRLSACVRGLRAIDAPIVARVQGAALAGGCALLTGCDFVVVAADAQLGYPTHRIGISPAISIPSLLSRLGAGARALLMSNDIWDGRTAFLRGLATHCADPLELDATVDRLVESLLSKGPNAMRATKRWIREIEDRGAGDLGWVPPRDAHAIACARDASVALAAGEEFATMLRAFWATRAGK